jgi:subfamily B ATP-binding cassette protein HlyB/CyaB
MPRPAPSREASASDPSIAVDDLLWALGGLCRAHRLAFDAALLRERFPPPCKRSDLIEAAAALGLKTGTARLDGRPLDAVPLPCVAYRRADARPALVLKTDGERLIYAAPESDLPRTAMARECAALFEPWFVLARRDDDAPGAPVPGFDDERRPFGFRWFVPALARHRGVWRDVLLASLFIQLIGLTTPLFTQVIVDKVIVHHTHGTLAAVAFGLAVFLVFNAVMTWLRQYLQLHTGNRVDAVLAAEVLRHLLRLPLAYFERRPTGVTVARLHGVETIREFITGATMSFVLDAPFLVVVLAVMFWYSWQLSLIALAAVAALGALSAAATPLLRARLDRQFMLGARNQAFLTEYVGAAETVKGLQLEPVLERRYAGYLAGYLSASFSTRQLANTCNVVAGSVEQAMTIAVLLAGALLVMRGDGFTIGMLVAFQMFAARMAQPMLRLAGLWQELQQASIAVRRLGDIMNAPPEPHALEAALPPGAAPATFELQDISFRYGDRQPWLFRGLSLRLRPGSLVLVTGPSGCGKSTLAKLLLGFYAPQEGRILLGGRDLCHLAANELRRAFGVVLQDAQLFSGTIHDNLVMANPRATLEEMVSVCRQAEIHDAIARLPQGYRTAIGEHGVGLSGGQKQRLAIARALLRRPRILVFDEATSGLDAPAAEAIARTINRLKGSATVLFIAHQVPKGLAVDEVARFDERRDER